MAEIPVEKEKSSKSWLWIVLALLLVGLLIWWLLAEAGEEEDGYVHDDIDVSAVDPDANVNANTPLTTIAMIASGTGMIGREVELSDIAVNEVVGDMGFTVGDGSDETLVMFNQVPTPDTPTEGQIDVNPGSRVAIMGAVQGYDGNVPTSVSREIEANTEVFIDATNVRVLD